MSKRVSLSVSLTAELAAFLAERVGSGRYDSGNEVVGKGLRLLEDKEKAPPRRRTRAEVEQVVDEC